MDFFSKLSISLEKIIENYSIDLYDQGILSVPCEKIYNREEIIVKSIAEFNLIGTNRNM